MASKTDILRIDGIVPTVPAPLGSTLTSVTYRVSRLKTGDLGLTETKVQPRKAGAALGSNITTSYVVTTSEVQELFTISSGLPTATEFNTNMGLDLQYTQESSHANWNDPTKWTIGVSGGGTSAVMVVTATYIGAGTVPTYVYVNISSLAKAFLDRDGVGPYPFKPWTGNGTADNGQGTTNTGALVETGTSPDPPSTDATTITASSAVRTRIALVAGTGSATLTRSVIGTTNQSHTIVNGSYTGSAALSAYVTATALVGSVDVDACWSLTSSVTSGVSWPFIDFLDPNKMWALKSTGALDELRYNTVTNAWIQPTSNRDGGYPIEEMFWQSTWIKPSEVSILLWVRLLKGINGETVAVSAKTDRDGTLNVASVVRDAYKFSMSQQGKSHQVRIDVYEDTDAVTQATLEFQQLSDQFTR